MKRVLLLAAIALAVAGCGRQPTPAELAVSIVDDPYYVRSCRRLGDVSPVVTTTPGFDAAVESMLQATMSLGGTDLFMSRRSHDWLLVKGVAYRCPWGQMGDPVVVRRLG